MSSRRHTAVFLAAAVAAAFAASGGSAFPWQEPAGPLRLLSVTPSGEDVPPGRQIVFQFDRPVVPVGRMDRDADAIPIDIAPSLECEWRWISTSALACQLGEDQALAPATRYTLVVRPGFRAQDGARLAEEETRQFVTARPAIQYANFRTWRGPGTPQIWLNMNQAVERASLERHLYFKLPDGERIALTVTPPEAQTEPQGVYWIGEPVRELPLASRVHLEVEPGLLSKLGPEPSTETKTVVEFFTFPEHRFLGIRCRDNEGRTVDVPPSAWVRTERACNPLEDVALLFSAPVIKEIARDHLIVEPDLAGGRDDYDPWENVYSYSRLNYPRRELQEYPVQLPTTLKARTEYHVKASAAELKDEFARPLAIDIDVRFSTDDRPPRLVLTHPVSALESDVDTHVPLVVTNLEEVAVDFQGIMPHEAVKDEVRVTPPEALNVAQAIPLKVRDWLGGGSGAVLAHLDSTPTTRDQGRWFFSSVSPFQVHTKLGHRNTAVWVTDLESGLPVEGARVGIYSGVVSQLGAEGDFLTEGTTSASGLAVLDGNTQIDPDLDFFHWGSLIGWTGPSSDPYLFVRVDKDGEMALAPLSGDFSVRSEGPNNSWIPNDYRRRFGHLMTWGTTAQGVYRVGDTVEFKFYVRDQSNETFVPAPATGYKLQVHDPMDKLVHEVVDLSLNEFGAYAGDFIVPETGAVGWYRFRLTADFIEDASWYPLQVLVSDFTPAPFRVTTDVNGDLFHPGDNVSVATSATLHAGGPYADAAGRLAVSLRSTPLTPKDPKATGFFFDTGPARDENLYQSETSVNAQGEHEQTVTLPDSPIVYGALRFESSVRDDRGKYVSGRAPAIYAGRDRFVGIRQPDWLLEAGKPSQVLAIVVDETGSVRAGADLTIRVEHRETTASRVKGAGNAYLTEYEHRWVEVSSCRETSAAEPVICAVSPDNSGLFRFTARVTDTLGRTHESSLQRWSLGKGQVLWETPPGHHLPIEPEKEEYRVGETARFLVRNPFPGARAWLTIERIGVQRSWSEVLEDSTELIEFEVTPDHLPGFYFSVVVASPRVEAPLGDGEVDLGKPAFRMGYVRVPVRDPYKEIEIDVRPEKDTYRPRETVAVDLLARPRHAALADTAHVPPMELAVAVLDEAVFDLIQGGTRYFDPYQGFYELEPLDVRNYNLLTRLIGIQNFEKKGANPGGGGATGLDMRSVFKFVSYWNPSLRPDGEGRARIEFEAPDNLTGWRVLAMAVTRDDRMGLGEGTFAVNQFTELRPAMPNQITEGDRFDARFTVMNRTEGTRTLVIDASVEGPAESPGLESLRIEAEPFKRYPVTFPVRSLKDGEIVFAIRAGDVEDGDALRHRLTVNKRTALQAAANYGTTTENEVTEALVFPEAIRTDVGEVSVVTSPSVIGGVEGAFRYMRDYPYICWEQVLTKGVMASHFSHLRGYLSDDVEWEGHQALPDYTLRLAAKYQAPNGGMVYYIPEDQYVSPYLSAYTALAFHWLRERGHAVPGSVEDKLHQYLLNLLRTDVFPDFYTRGMASSVRAVALAALARQGKVNRADIDRYRRHVSEMDLFGKAHYLMAAATLGADAALREEVRNDILAHSNQSGGKFTFSESIDVDFKRILYSSVKSNCAILTALVSEQAPGLGDVPFKLTRSITAERERRDRWENTQDNMFCMNALVDYSQAYEKDEPAMTLRTYLDDEELGTTEFRDLRDPASEVTRPLRAGDPGRGATVRIERAGTGRLYYATRLFYSPVELKKDPINSGMEVRREYSVERDGEWLPLEDPIRLRTGELVRVDLYLSLPAPRNFVVLDDPVPGGLEPVNRDLATASEFDAEKAEMERPTSSYWFTFSDWKEFGYSRWSFYHRELRHHSARFYSEYLPAGNYHLSYVGQAIAPGEFQVGPVHVGEMYDPDVFGQGVPATLRVEAAP